MARRRRAAAGRGGGGGTRTVLGLVALAGIATGGVLLYQHTSRYPQSGAATRYAPGSDSPSTGIEPGLDRTPGSASRAQGSAEAKGVQAGAASSALPGSGAEAAPRGRPLPQAPFGESEDVFETGARVYVAHCASCHGLPGRDAVARSGADTPAIQLWHAQDSAVARGVARSPGAIYLEIADGVPGMAGYRHILSETQIWDLTLLLRNAGQELPDPVLHLLSSGR